MAKSRIAAYMHKLLIENSMDDFTVVELRNKAISLCDAIEKPVDLRNKLYRQVLLMEKKGLLRSEGNGRSKKYSKTDRIKER